MISIIIPVYNEEKSIIGLVEKLEKLLENIKIEIIVIDDGSIDYTWEKIKNIKLKNNNHALKGIRFYRNFGKEAAIYAGLLKAKGDAAIIIDADGEHPPELVPKMISFWKNGYEIVEAIKKERQKESFFKTILVNIFFIFFKLLTDLDIKNLTDFKLLSRKAIDIYIKFPERKKFFRGLISWSGIKSKKIFFSPKKRKYGKSSWNYFKLFSLAWESIVSFSIIPLRLLFMIGLIGIIISIILIIQTLYMKLSGKALGGFTTVILLQILFGSGIILGIGIIGEYLAQIYEEIKKRPLFIIEEEIEVN